MKSYDVYLVWYKCDDLGRALWGVYRTKEEADTIVKYILDNQLGTDAWCNGEMFGTLLD